MRRLSICLALAFAWLLLAGAAQAHTRSESHSSWVIDKQLVRVSVTFPDVEAQRITHGARPSDADVLRYLTPRLGATAEGKACRPAAAPRMVQSTTGYRRAEMSFDCASEKDIVLRFSGFFDLAPNHYDLAQVQLPNGEVVEQLFLQDSQTLDVTSSQGGEFKDAGFLRFIQMGVMHIFTGVDHMCFLLGLVLISRRLRDLIFVVSGFTIGHSITLALAVTGIIRPHAQFIDALVALTIALIGVENIVVSLKRPTGMAIATGVALLAMAGLSLFGIGLLPPTLLFGAALFSACYLMVSGQLHDSGGKLRMVVTMVFGLIHGFGFAADLLEAHLPPQKLAQILVGFNVGVEIGQLSVVLAITGLVAVARKVRLATPRPITVDVLASGLVAIGTAWFVTRCFP